MFAILTGLGRRYDFTLDEPIKNISDECINAVLNGDSEPLKIDMREFASYGGTRMVEWEGIGEYIAREDDDSSGGRGDKWAEQFVVKRRCEACGGTRLKPEALQFRIGGKNIAEVSAMSIEEFRGWIKEVPAMLTEREMTIAREILKEIGERLGFLLDVGLGYLSLSRSSRSLSGGVMNSPSTNPLPTSPRQGSMPC